MFNYRYKYLGYFAFAYDTKGTLLVKGYTVTIDGMLRLAQCFRKKYPETIIKFAKI